MNESQNKLFQEILKNAFETKPVMSGHLLDDEDILLRWTENQLSSGEHQQLLSHLAQCSECRKNVSDMIKRGILVFQPNAAATQILPEPQPKPQNEPQPKPQNETNSQNGRISSKSHNRVYGAMMTAAACLLLGFFLLWNSPGYTPQDQITPDPGGVHTPTVRGTEGDTENSSPGPRHALLVGINDYANLPESQWLAGCHNDVARVKALLEDRFGFQPENITVLLDEQATAEGLREQFRNLVRMVESLPADGKPAQVVFYFSGHGSRILDQPPGHPDHDSEDGYDSTLVVYDSEKMGGDIDIRDDEINRFAHAICEDKKAEMMIVLDSCHSGGGARGATRFRGIDRNLPRPTPEALSSKLRIPKTLPSGVVFFSACLPSEKEPEHPYDGKIYGLFTFYFTQLLSSETTVSSMNYQVLRDAVHNAYARDKISQRPFPTVEGDVLMLRKPVLGAGKAQDYKPYFTVEKNATDPSLLRVEAGRLAGVTVHSLYELYARVEDVTDPKAESLGWFEIVKVEGGYALGTFFRWADAERSRRLEASVPEGFCRGYAIVRYHDYGDNTLAIRVEDAATGDVLLPGTDALPQFLRDFLTQPGNLQRSRWLRWVGDAETCDLVLRLDFQSGLTAIFPATGFVADGEQRLADTKNSNAPASLRGGWGPVAWRTEEGVRKLDEMLQQIMKATAVKRLLAIQDDPLRKEKDRPQRLEIRVMEVLPSGEVRPISPSPAGKLAVDVHDDREYQVRIKNNDSLAFFITALCVDPNMQIDALDFGPEDNIYQFDKNVGLNNNPMANRLGPGQEFISQFRFSAPYGVHTLGVLATREPSNFLHFVQPGQTQARSAGSASATTILEFLEDQCLPGTRAGRRHTPPRDDTWTATGLDILTSGE